MPALPLAFAHIDAGAVIAAAGGALIGMFVLPLALQPAFVTVTFSVTAPDPPAVNVTTSLAAPFVITPFAIVQL